MLFAGLYDIFIRWAWWIIRLLSLRDQKLRLLVRSRNLEWPVLKGDGRLIWMHCASLGEYEQGKSLLKKWRVNEPGCRILVSFFSPSGYEVVQGDPLADAVCYLPLDTRRNVLRFLDFYRPDMAIFVKYEFWFNLLSVMNQKKIPAYFIAVHLDREHFIFKWFGKPIRDQLRLLSGIFVQDRETLDRLEDHHFTNGILAGDTRIDAVTALPETPFKDERITRFITGNRPIFVVGSAWPEDMDLLAALDEKIIGQCKWIMAPHEISGKQIESIRRKSPWEKTVLYSEKGLVEDADLLIVDQIGILKYIYRFARLVYIGGGFGDGIHNTLEPAAYGKPVIFGPRYRKFVEAKRLADAGAFFPVENVVGLERAIRLLDDPVRYDTASRMVEDYLREHQNATETIFFHLLSTGKQ